MNIFLPLIWEGQAKIITKSAMMWNSNGFDEEMGVVKELWNFLSEKILNGGEVGRKRIRDDFSRMPIIM